MTLMELPVFFQATDITTWAENTIKFVLDQKHLYSKTITEGLWPIVIAQSHKKHTTTDS